MAWILIVAILLLSLVPPMLRPNTDIPHNVEHFTIFLLTGFAFGIGYPRRYLLQSIALVVFALSIEISQLWALGRHARLSDFVVDALAACIGIGAIEWVRQPQIRQRFEPAVPVHTAPPAQDPRAIKLNATGPTFGCRICGRKLHSVDVKARCMTPAWFVTLILCANTVGLVPVVATGN